MSVRFNSELSHAFSATASATTPQTLIAAAAGRKTLLYRLFATLSVAGTIQLQDTGGTNLSEPIQLAANTPFYPDMHFNLDPLWFTGVGLGIQAVITGGGALSFDAWYLQV